MGVVRPALVWLILAAATPAFACEVDSGAARLPGESLEEFEQRDELTLRDRFIVRHHLREKHAFENARSVYIAEVVSRRETPLGSTGIRFPSVTVKPVSSIKGSLPNDLRTLTDQTTGGECTDIGDGKAAYGKVGSLVLVFEGLPRSAERPNGIDSLRATDVRTFELLQALASFVNRPSSG